MFSPGMHAKETILSKLPFIFHQLDEAPLNLPVLPALTKPLYIGISGCILRASLTVVAGSSFWGGGVVAAETVAVGPVAAELLPASSLGSRRRFRVGGSVAAGSVATGSVAAGSVAAGLLAACLLESRRRFQRGSLTLLAFARRFTPLMCPAF